MVPTVVSEVVGETGYIGLNTFTDNADELFLEHVQDFSTRVSSRSCSTCGTIPAAFDTAIEVASAFLPDGDVVVTEAPTPRPRTRLPATRSCPRT